MYFNLKHSEENTDLLEGNYTYFHLPLGQDK